MRSTVGNRPKNPIFQSERKTEPAKFSKNQSKNSKPDNNFDSDILASQISEGDEDVSEGHNYSEHSENEVHYFDRNKIESNANANQLSSGAQDMNHNFPRISHQRK